MNSPRPIGTEASVALEQNRIAMIILKFNEWLKFQPDVRNTVYQLCKDDFTKIRNISKEEAIQLIKEEGLTRVYRDKHGAIWK